MSAPSTDPIGTVCREDHDDGHSIWVRVGRALVSGYGSAAIPWNDPLWRCVHSTAIGNLGFEVLDRSASWVTVGAIPGTPATSAPQGDTAPPSSSKELQTLELAAYDVIVRVRDEFPRRSDDAPTEDIVAALLAAGLLAASPAAPQAAGYIIAGPDKDGRMECDWDGKVHESRADGDAELALCRETYDDWGLYAMYPVGPSAPAPADDEAAQVERMAAALARLDGWHIWLTAMDKYKYRKQASAALAARKEGQQ